MASTSAKALQVAVLLGSIRPINVTKKCIRSCLSSLGTTFHVNLRECRNLAVVVVAAVVVVVVVVVVGVVL